MTGADFRRVAALFEAACDLPSGERTAFLDRECAGDANLRREVDELLAEDDGETTTLDTPALGADFHVKAAVEWREDPPDQRLPEQIGRFRILAVAGRGGMGTVFLAEQDEPRRRVALKMLRPGVMSRSLLRRFKLEAEVLARLNHPGIAQVYEVGTHDAGEGGQPYFVMEFIDGPSVTAFCRTRALGRRQRLELFAEICDAVHHAHQKGVIHRDLKPDNVLIVEDEARRAGRPKVLDFGIARATDGDVQVTTLQTDVGQLIGTVPYMSPEQVSGDMRGIDTRSDIYALGVLLYELLVDRLPYDLSNRSIPEAIRVIREDDPTRLSTIDTAFRGDLDTIVAKALEKDVDRRYQSAAALGADIRRHLRDEPIEARPPSTFYYLRKFARRNKTLVGGIAATFAVLVLGAVVATVFAIRATRNEAAAVRSSYRSSITAALATIDVDPRLAAMHLAEAPEALRNWEWRYLSARLDRAISEYRVDAPATPLAPERHAVAFRPDGTPVYAVATDTTVRLVDLGAGTVVRNFDAGMSVGAVGLSADGSRLGAAAGKRLVAWDAATGRVLLDRVVDGGASPRLAFDGDGSHLAWFTETGRVIVFEVETGRVCQEQRADRLPASAKVAFSADASRVAMFEEYPSAGWNRTQVRRLNGEEIATSGDAERTEYLGGISADGTKLAMSDDRTVVVRDAETLAEIVSFRGHDRRPKRAMSFSPDGTILASVAEDEVRLWDLAAGRPAGVYPIAAGSVAVDGDDAELAATAPDGAEVWGVGAGASTVLAGHESYVYVVTYSPDGALIASGDFDGNVRLWDAATGDLVAAPSASQLRPMVRTVISGLSFSADGSRLYAQRTGEDALQEWALDAIEEPAAIVSPDAAWGPRRPVTLEGGGAPLPAFYGVALGCSTLLDANRASSAISADGSLFVTGFRETVRLYDARTGRRLATLFTPADQGKHHAVVAFSRDGAMVAAGFADGIVRMWDARSGAELAAMTGHDGDVYALAFSPDGTRLATGGNDQTIRLWDLASLTQVAALRGHESYVMTLAFSPDGTQLASGSGDGTVRIWDSVPQRERRAAGP